MALGDLSDDERFVLALSMGILGAIFLGAFALILLDGYIFDNDDRYDDGEEDEEYRYMGDTLLQTSNSQPTTEQERPVEQEEPLPEQSTPEESKKIREDENTLQTKADQEIQQATKEQATLQQEANQENERVVVKTSINAVEVASLTPEDNEDDEEEPTNKQKQHKLQVRGVVVPRVEKVPWHRFFWEVVLIGIPTIGYIMYFTALGWGETTFYYMTEHYGEYASAVGNATAFLFVLLYLLDANFWSNRWLLEACFVVLVAGIVLSVLLLTGDYPYGPICCFAFIVPLWLITCNQFQCCKGKLRTRDYVSSLSGPLLFVSVVTLAAFLIWAFTDTQHEYNRVTKVAYSQATGCVPNLEDYPYCAVDYVGTETPTTSTTTTTNEPVFVDGNGTDRFLQEDDTLGNNTGISSFEETTMFTLSEVDRLNSLNDRNVFTAEETGVCFDTVLDPPAFTLHPGCDPACPEDVYDNCLNSFILWVGPLLCSMVLFFLSFFCTFLQGEDAEKDIVNFGKLWLFLLFSMWLTASLSGVAAGLSGALVAMTLASFMGSIVFVATTRSKEESKEQGVHLWQRIEENYGAHMDIARGLFLVTCTPIIIVYLFFSILNQCIRKLGLPCSKPLKTPEQRADFVTKRARNQITAFRSWDRTKVLVYAIYWGIAFMILQVIVSQFTVLFLSWLIEYTSSLNLGIVTAILVGVGMIMFLLPPVPGVPIYLTLGIVILAVGRDLLGLYGAMLYASAVSLALKLVACTVQQKLIGESLAQSVGIRKLVGINSTVIKAMRLILAQPGMGFDKVCILVGGPDWPTSVLCGIMGLDLLPVLFGTLPVFFLILPTMLTGSFTYMAGLRNDDGELEYPSAAVLGTVFAAVTAVVQFGAMILAAYYLEKTASNRTEEIAAIPNDKEVAELEEAETAFNQAYEKVTKWPVLPLFFRLVLYVSFALVVASCYMVQFFSTYCWAEYELTYTIGEHLDGKWYKLVLPLGWLAIALFCLSCFLICGFILWASGEANKVVEASLRVPSETDPSAAAEVPVSASAGTVGAVAVAAG